MNLHYTLAAHAHISRIYDYIEMQNPLAASRVVARIRSAAERLTENPEMGRIGAAVDTREWVVRGLPYIIVYEVQAERGQVVVLGIYHGAQQRPGQVDDER